MELNGAVPAAALPAQRSEHLSLNWSQVLTFRLTRHHLADSRPADLAQIVSDVCGIQAQVFSAAEMALWARGHSLTRAVLQSALWSSRALVKTCAMRGTLHLLAADDLPVYISALKRSRTRQLRQVMFRYGATSKEAEGVKQAALEALSGGPLARPDLTQRVLSLGIAGKKARRWFEQSWWGVGRQALSEGLICYGPNRGPETTLVRVDQWLPKQEEVPELEAKRVLFRRYLRAYGPATLQDFSKWTGMAMEETTAVWESLKGELLEVRFEGQKGLIRREDYGQLRMGGLRGFVLRLLPSFDPYLLGHVDKRHLVDNRHYKRVYRKAGWISPVVLLNGRVTGRGLMRVEGSDCSWRSHALYLFPRTFAPRLKKKPRGGGVLSAGRRRSSSGSRVWLPLPARARLGRRSLGGRLPQQLGDPVLERRGVPSQHRQAHDPLLVHDDVVGNGFTVLEFWRRRHVRVPQHGVRQAVVCLKPSSHHQSLAEIDGHHQ